MSERAAEPGESMPADLEQALQDSSDAMTAEVAAKLDTGAQLAAILLPDEQAPLDLAVDNRIYRVRELQLSTG